ncbi:hypothetical protein K432DRAFT_395885 [Lepidopterella palustris CBS 459.81]|uniref:Serine hydrolase domain-containing protein n=1 Tax=Lepidopterella palustris CBS 459.81 TaxID=1314670 RepID=A0A8E2E4E1_9PEZI|nr:hypothetical protein K432DRAFT_395885 [Lepidopterella palustris CBS 459.81]
MTSDHVSKALPRILCLHGGGVNAEIFRITFRLVSADGPFYCDPGPGIVPVYEEYGPFRRWLRWLPEHPEVEAKVAVDEIWYKLRDAMEKDDLAGATGPWLREAGKNAAEDDAKPDFRFAVLLAGRAPVVSMRQETDDIKAFVTAAEVSEGFDSVDTETNEHILQLPTIHVHGLQDGGLHLHRRLLQQYCDPSTTRPVEWDGAHRVPLKSSDVHKVTDAILEVARNEGVIQ